jgi:vacuolar-type H+-ATPase subunit H
MVWLDFDWLKYESEQFQESLNHRIREAYLAADSVLEKAHGEAKEKLYGELNNATDDESRELTTQVIYYEEFRWIDQTEAVSADGFAALYPQPSPFLRATI